MPPQNSKHYHVPFGNDANFVNHSGVATIKIQQFFRNSSSTLARLARHPSAFTSMCGTDTAGRGPMEPPPEGGARTKPYSTENSSSANRILRTRQKNPDQNPWHQGMTRYSRTDFIYIYLCARGDSNSRSWPRPGSRITSHLIPVVVVVAVVVVVVVVVVVLTSSRIIKSVVTGQAPSVNNVDWHHCTLCTCVQATPLGVTRRQSSQYHTISGNVISMQRRSCFFLFNCQPVAPVV